MSAQTNVKAALMSTHGTRDELLAAVGEALVADEPTTRMRLYAAFVSSATAVRAAADTSVEPGTGWFPQLNDNKER